MNEDLKHYANTPAFSSENIAGLTTREYFAAKAMQGLIGVTNVYEYREMAKRSVEAADCLLAELAKEDYRNLTTY